MERARGEIEGEDGSFPVARHGQPWNQSEQSEPGTSHDIVRRHAWRETRLNGRAIQIIQILLGTSSRPAPTQPLAMSDKFPMTQRLWPFPVRG